MKVFNRESDRLVCLVLMGRLFRLKFYSPKSKCDALNYGFLFFWSKNPIWELKLHLAQGVWTIFDLDNGPKTDEPTKRLIQNANLIVLSYCIDTAI